jgi:hypothetical protein
MWIRLIVAVLTLLGAQAAMSEQAQPGDAGLGTGQARHVTIDAEGVCHIDGKPFLPMGFYLKGEAPSLKTIGEPQYFEHYNVAVMDANPSRPKDSRCGLDLAAHIGVFAMLNVRVYLMGDEADYDGLRDRVISLRDEPALLAWNIADEPTLEGDYPERIRRGYQLIKEVDPNHPVYIVTTRPEDCSRLAGMADVIGMDPYPVGNPWAREGPYPDAPLITTADWTDAAVEAARANGQAVWMVPQAFGWDEIGENRKRGGSQGYRLAPTTVELSNMMYQCFIHDTNGILWFGYLHARRFNWWHFQRLGKQWQFLEPWILHGRDVPGMPAGVRKQGDPNRFASVWKGTPLIDVVHWRAWVHEGRVLILAANVVKRSVQIDMPLPLGVRQVSLPFEDRVVGVVSDEHPREYAPYIREGKLTMGFGAHQAAAIVFDLP